MRQNYKEAEEYFNNALKATDYLGETSLSVKATIMCKLGYILYKQKGFLRAHGLFSDGENLARRVRLQLAGGVQTHTLLLYECVLLLKAALIEGCDEEFSSKCEGFAIWCYDQLKKQHCKPPTLTTINHSALDESADKTDDEECSESDESSTSDLGAESAGGFSILRNLSRRFSKNVQEEKEDSEEDEDEMEQDEANPSHALNNRAKSVRFSTIKDSTSADTSIPTTSQDYCDQEKAPTEDTIPAREPTFEERLVPIADEHSATRYRQAVECPWMIKLLRALGVKPSSDPVALPSDDVKFICKKALEYLLALTADCQTKYELEFEGVLVEEMNTNFISLKKLINDALQ